MKLANVELTRLRTLIEAERSRQRGTLSVNISPYAIVVQSIFWHDAETIRKGLAAPGRRERILLTEEMELPDWAHSASLVNAIQILDRDLPQT